MHRKINRYSQLFLFPHKILWGNFFFSQYLQRKSDSV